MFKVFETIEDCSAEELEKKLNDISTSGWTVLSVVREGYSSIYLIIAYKNAPEEKVEAAATNHQQTITSKKNQFNELLFAWEKCQMLFENCGKADAANSIRACHDQLQEIIAGQNHGERSLNG